MARIEKADVIIIGAGLSGLAAALQFKERGLSIAVLEARNRPGGRVETKRQGSFSVDLGAQWISVRHARVKALLRRYSIQCAPTPKKGSTVFALRRDEVLRGKSGLPPLSWPELFSLYRIARKLDKMAASVGQQAPWSSKDAVSFDRLSVADWVEEQRLRPAAERFCKACMEELLCESLAGVSLLDLLWTIAAAGGTRHIYDAENWWIPEGAQLLPDRMAEELGDAVHYNFPVQRVEWSDSSVSVYAEEEAVVWHGRRLVIAMPPIVSRHIQYEPMLPAKRTELCERLGAGAVIKTAVMYRTPFWRSAGHIGQIYLTEGPFHIAIDSSPKEAAFGELIVLTCGSKAVKASKQNKEEWRQSVHDTISRCFGPTTEQPIAVIEKHWLEDPWALGGYAAHFEPTVLTACGSALVDPIGPIYFAGTETASEWRLYMEGALQSAERVVEQVLAGLGYTFEERVSVR